MTDLKKIPQNNVIIVDGEKSRAVFYHMDPERLCLDRPEGTLPYVAVMRAPHLIIMGVN